MSDPGRLLRLAQDERDAALEALSAHLNLCAGCLTCTTLQVLELLEPDVVAEPDLFSELR